MSSTSTTRRVKSRLHRRRHRTSRRSSVLPGAGPRAASCRAQRTRTGSQGRGAETRSISSRSRRRPGSRSSSRSGTGGWCVSPFTFYRGAALIMAADLAKHTGLWALFFSFAVTLICPISGRSPHPTGPSSSASTTSTRRCPDRSGGTSKRQVARFAVAGRDRGFSDKEARDRLGNLAVGAKSYRDAMHKKRLCSKQEPQPLVFAARRHGASLPGSSKWERKSREVDGSTKKNFEKTKKMKDSLPGHLGS